MTDIPHFFLYGETKPSDALDYIYIAALEESLPKHNWEISPHRHDNLHQLLVVEQGQSLIQVREEYGEENAHLILSIPPKEVHGFVHQPGVRGYIITIVESFLHGVFADGERQQFPHLFNEVLRVHLEPGSKPSWEFELLVRQIVNAYKEKQVGQNCLIGAYLKILFIQLWRAADHNEAPVRQSDARLDFYEKFQLLVEEHYIDHWSVKDYAERMGMTTGRLNRLCQRYTGLNAMQIVHERVLTEAKRKLIYADLSMNEVAFDLGFKDPAYFSRFFAKHCGLPPGKYKSRMRGKL